MTDSPFLSHPSPVTERYDTHVANSWVGENRFISSPPESSALPSYAQVREILPDPFWSGHQTAIDCYWRAWELAFSNLKRPSEKNGFIANYCDTAFNGNLFMWDSAFITCFGVYGRRGFDFQKTLDNFYRNQHMDGFICREIAEDDGQDCFHRFDPPSTGPNVLAWAEWNCYMQTADRSRLEMVFPALVAYHQWLRTYHTWLDGSYWSTGWGSGMDNQPRLDGNEHISYSHGHMTWVDTTLQAILSAKTLLQMAAVLGREEEAEDLAAEVASLSDFANKSLWSEKLDFYCDRFSNGELSPHKLLAAYWALLAECVPESRLAAFVAHLENPAEFNRPHRIPALSADDPSFSGMGDYWCGGVWPPTNYMTLKGLGKTGNAGLAHQIGLNHVENVVKVFESDNTPWTGAEQFRQFFHLPDLVVNDKHTLWENYAPDFIQPGGHSKPGYVGWTGLPPIAVLFEDVFGLTADAPRNRLTWHVRLLGEHGVRRYPFGQSGRLDLKCSPRESLNERPRIEIEANVPLTLQVIWDGGVDTLRVEKKD